MTAPDGPGHGVTPAAYRDALNRSTDAGGVTYAYRELGPIRGVPAAFFVHLAANLDNRDPRIIDAIGRSSTS